LTSHNDALVTDCTICHWATNDALRYQHSIVKTTMTMSHQASKLCKADDRRMIKLADTDFLGEVRTNFYGWIYHQQNRL